MHCGFGLSVSGSPGGKNVKGDPYREIWYREFRVGEPESTKTYRKLW
jgi:hypothetical protein